MGKQLLCGRNIVYCSNSLVTCGPEATITRDQSMRASCCLPACPIEYWALLMHMIEVWNSVKDS